MSVYKHAKSPFYQIEFHIDGRPFRGSSKTRSKKEAEALERQWRASAHAEIEARKRMAGDPMSLSIAASRYLDEVMVGKVSEADTDRALRRLLSVIDGRTLMSAVTDDHVARYIALRRRDTRWGRAARKDESPMGTVSNATINREVAVLKRLFVRARRAWKMILPNEPDWRSHILPEESERVRELMQDEEDALYAIRPDYLPWLEFAHMSGLRLNETLLRWTSVNFRTGQIRVKGKGGKWMTTQITPSIRAILEPLVGHHPDYVFTYVAKRSNRKTGIVRGKRYPLTYSGIQSLWARLKVKHGIMDLHIHDIRHDAASKIVRATGNLKIAQKLLNHSSIAVTARYAHVLDLEVAEAMERVALSRKKSRKADKGVA